MYLTASPASSHCDFFLSTVDITWPALQSSCRGQIQTYKGSPQRVPIMYIWVEAPQLKHPPQLLQTCWWMGITGWRSTVKAYVHFHRISQQKVQTLQGYADKVAQSPPADNWDGDSALDGPQYLWDLEASPSKGNRDSADRASRR